MSRDSTDNANKQNGDGQPTADSALAREAYVFGGALKDSVVKAAHDPWSLAKVGVGAAFGLGLTLIESRVAPLTVALEALGITSAVAALPGFIKDGKTATDVWSRTWNGTGNLNADRAAMHGISDGIVDFGLTGGGAMVSPAVRAYQLAERSRVASIIPWYSRPGVPPTVDMTWGFTDGLINVGQVTTDVLRKDGSSYTGKSAGFALAGEDNLFLTAGHSLDGAQRTMIEFPFGKNYAVDLLGWDKEKDLALLRLVNPDFKLPGLKLSESELRPGQPTMVVGFPVAHDGPLASMGYYKRDDQLANAPFVFSAKTKMGFSGGPHLDNEGDVAAMLLQTKPYWFDIFRPGNIERAKRGATEVSYGASAKQMRQFVEANRNNPGVRLPTFEE